MKSETIDDIPEHKDLYKYLLSFKYIFNDFYKFLKIYLSLDDATILRLLSKCKYTGMSHDTSTSILELTIETIIHYRMYKEFYEAFLNSYCPTIDLKLHKNLYYKYPILIDFMKYYKDLYKYLREVKSLTTDDINTFLTNIGYTTNSEDKINIARKIVDSQYHNSFMEDYNNFLESYDDYLNVNKENDEFLKQYLNMLEKINQGFKASSIGGFKKSNNKKTLKTAKAKKLRNKKMM